MADIDWIKTDVNMFDDEKIKLIEAMPEGDTIIVIWCKLMCFAGRVNDGGYVYVGQNLPCTDEMLATLFNKPLNVIRLALQVFEGFNMITRGNKGIFLVNWGEYQNVAGMEAARERARIRSKAWRERQKQGLPAGRMDTGTSRDANVTHVESDISESDDIESSTNVDDIHVPSKPTERIPYQQIMEDYNTICLELPKIKSISGGRYRTVKARWKEHPSIEEFRTMFRKVQLSPFLSGYGKDGWKANFDWLMKEQSFQRVLEGVYDKRDKTAALPETQAQRNEPVLQDMMEEEQRKEAMAHGYLPQGCYQPNCVD